MEKRIEPKKLILPILMVILATLLIITLALTEREDPERKTRSFYDCFDTVGTVFDYSGDSTDRFSENYQLAHATLKYYHRLFDIYKSHEGVAGLYEVNRNAGVAPVKVSHELIEFLEFCKEAYELTGGEVNIAMGSVLSLWWECREAAQISPNSTEIPSEEELNAASKHCDINKLIINREESTVYLEDAQMRLDVGAIGKGYAVEKAAEALLAAGAEGYVLDVGGNIRIIGDKPSGKGFRTGIKNPFGKEGAYVKILTLSDTSTVTSGGYERYFTVGDRRYHHIVDKDTLYPAEKFASVTVISADSGLADALSTALFCMDEEAGLLLIESLEEAEAVWVRLDESILCSSGIEEFDK